MKIYNLIVILYVLSTVCFGDDSKIVSKTEHFEVHRSKNSFILHLKSTVDSNKVIFKDFLKGNAGADYVYYPIAGQIGEGKRGFYVAGTGFVMIEIDKEIYMVEFDSKKEFTRTLKCSLIN